MHRTTHQHLKHLRRAARVAQRIVFCALVTLGFCPAMALAASGKQPIVVSIAADGLPACVGDTVFFFVDAYDPDGEIVLYEWNFQKGSAWVVGDVDMEWVFTSEKQYNVGVRVTDDDGFKTVAHIKVDIGCDDDPDPPTPNLPPTVDVADAPATAPIDVPVTFHADAQDTDGTIVSYDWDFGDGNVGSGDTVSHTYTQTADEFLVRVTVTDDAGATASASHVVVQTVEPVDPPKVFVAGTRMKIRVTPSTGGMEVDYD